MPSLDEELLEEEERQREEQMASMAQQQRMQKMQEEAAAKNQQSGSIKNQALNSAKKMAKDQIKSAVKKSAMEVIAATSPYWGSALLFFLCASLIFIVVISVPAYACKSSYFDGITVAALKVVVALVPGDVCEGLEQVGGRSGGGGASNTSSGLDIAITGAYRPGSIVAGTGRLSAHSRGEAVDISLRNPQVPEHSSDPRIAELVQIAQSMGFTPTAGDTLDEYTNPTEGATAGHVHVEFNLKPDGTTYCDGTRIPSSGPTDLIPIPSTIPVQGASDPRLRPCMIDAVNALFNAAGFSAP